MRYVDRDGVRPPRWFASGEAEAGRKMLRDFFRRGEKVVSQTRFDENLFAESIESGRAEIAQALQELFGGTCAFCETPQWTARIHRFRPSTSAEPVYDTSQGHLYYSWLAYAWQNLYPICPECQPEAPRYFPVISNERAPLPSQRDLEAFIRNSDGRWPTFPLSERPVLIDPCSDKELWKFLRFFPNGGVASRDEYRGETTIEHFSLDRDALCSDRQEAFRGWYEKLRSFLSGEGKASDVLDPSNGTYPGAWQILLRETLRLALGRTRAPSNLETALSQLKKKSDALDRFGDATRILSEEEMDFIAHEAADPEELARAGYYQDATVRGLPASVEIRNFKSLERLRLQLPDAPDDGVETTPALLILGENAAGKSTILEAIALALMSPDARRMLPLDPDDLVLNPKYLGGRKAGPSKSEITVNFRSDQSLTLTIKRSRGRTTAGFEEKGPSSRLPLFAYGAFRQYQKGERRNSKHRHVRSLFQSEELLSNPEKWILALDPSDFDMVARVLKSVFAIDDDVQVLEKEDGQVFVVSALEEEGITTRTPMSVVSSGFRSVLAMLCDIMHGLMNKKLNPRFETLDTARGLVLIDEIEAHLHPRWKVSIMTGLRRALPNVCFMATSHDPLCLRGMLKGEVLVMERVEETSDLGLPVMTQSLVDLPDNHNWTVQQLLTADFFQLRSTEGSISERRRAEVEDMLARGETAEDHPEIRAYFEEFSRELPIGDSDVHRLVHEAIAEYLAKRRQATQKQMQGLRKETKARILNALQGDDEIR